MITKGTYITCPKCQRFLYTIAYNIYEGVTIIKEDLFEPIAQDVPRPVDGQVINPCPTCGTYFTRVLRGGGIDIHVLGGWAYGGE